MIDRFDSGGNFLAQGNGGWGGAGTYLYDAAFSNATNLVYIPDSNGDDIWRVDTNGSPVSKFPGSQFGSGCCYLYGAADNSGGAGDGTVYISSSGAALTGIYKIDGDGNPVNFTASGSYISGSTLTGTDSASFGFSPDGGQIAVDGDGRLIVVDAGRNVIDIFKPSGEFVEEISGTPGGSFSALRGVAVDPTSNNFVVVDSGTGTLEEFAEDGSHIDSTGGAETPTGAFSGTLRDVAIDSSGRVYLIDAGNLVVQVFSANVVLPKISYGTIEDQTQTSGTLTATVDPNEGGDVLTCVFEFGATPSYGTTIPCDPNPAAAPPGSNFKVPTVVKAEVEGLTPETAYHYRVVVTNSNGSRKGPDRVFQPHAVAGLTTEPVTNLEPTSVTLNGSWNGEGDGTKWKFEWGTTIAYGNVTPLVDNGPATGPVKVSAGLTGLVPVTKYHYRIVATNSAGTSFGADVAFETPPNAPIVKQWVTDVHSDSALIHGEVNPGGGQTTFHVEYVDDAAFQVTGFAAAKSVPVPDLDVGTGVAYIPVKQMITGLTPGTTYHYRVTATNAQDVGYAPVRTLHTFPYVPILSDPCENALERKQTGSALLLDCRAYELVSAPDTGAYNVESDIVAGQTPYEGYPLAQAPARVLYTMFDGGIPGSGDPTNRGRDPYIATRGAHEWTTEYVGIPATNEFAAGPFRSAVTGASQSLDALAFSDSDVCSPCFEGGGTGIPIRIPGSGLVQGMVGSIPQAAPVAAGEVRRHFSADGSHFIFGSTTKLEPDATAGEITIYDRNLKSGVTRVVSRKPDGSGAMTGAGIAALDVSADGSRILIGRLLNTDAKGNRRYHLYMSVGAADRTIDLSPGTTTGALYAGMSANGSDVYFATDDALAGDGDTGADLYRASVSATASTLSRVSTGSGSGDQDACAPAAAWNAVSGGADCGILAIPGGAGVAADGSAAYFLSPEKLDGSGAAGEPNLFVAKPGQAPVRVTTLEVGNPLVAHALSAVDEHSWGDFQISPNGDFAALTSTLALEGAVDNAGHHEVYRYDLGGGGLDCVSCNPTGVRSAGDSSLAAHGLSVTDGGDVFFNSEEPLAPRDLNGRPDAYQWKDGEVQLISPGSSPYDSGLLSVSADGVDAFFFTRDNLAPQDLNGQSMKIYDARAGGGFFILPDKPPCAASDECHGPSSTPAPAPSIGTVNGTGGNSRRKSCKKGQAKKAGKCVKKKKARKKKAKRSRGGGSHG